LRLDYRIADRKAIQHLGKKGEPLEIIERGWTSANLWFQFNHPDGKRPHRELGLPIS